MQTIIVTGSNGLIGSECVRRFSREGYRVVGIDNGMRAEFFGEEASTRDKMMPLVHKFPSYVNCQLDIRDFERVEDIVASAVMFNEVAAIIHCAAQPSHDWAASDPMTDFDINARATLNLLECTRKYCPQAAFVFCSTNKVYGDNVNRWEVGELPTRFDFPLFNGIDEYMEVDQCTHSLFGCSKLAADIMVQEYGRYFGMNTVCFRAGCITGPGHAGAKQHGFLSYLVRCAVRDEEYQIIGYGGKQVRDNLHAADMVEAFWQYLQQPSPGAVYNLGGGRDNSCSILEAITLVEELTGRKMRTTCVDEPRKGDHKWWITDTSKFRGDYPDWIVKHDLRSVLKEMVEAEENRLETHHGDIRQAVGRV